MAVRKKQSKRFSTRHRAKVDKKLREHKRKLNKGLIMKTGSKTKSKKDPGIPTSFPGRVDFVKQAMAETERDKMQRKQNNELAHLMRRAQESSTKHESKASAVEQDEGIIFDNSKRAFYKEFKSVVEKSDVILQVLDARDPLGCRVKEVEELVAAGGMGGQKRIILVLNKIDLVPADVLKGWLRHLRTEYPCIAFKASTQSQKKNIGRVSVATESALNSSECLGADTLIQLLKNYSRSLNIKTAIRVGVVGYPNVGKSSLINSLKRTKVCNVGATPGVTTCKQEIKLDKNIKLLDCPGIVFSSSNGGELFLRNCLKVEQLEDPISPVSLILERASTDQMMQLYSIGRYHDTEEFLTLLAQRQGRLRKGGLVNLEDAAKSVLNDWNQGKIPFYMSPPLAPSHEKEQISVAANWAPEFDLDNLDDHIPTTTMSESVMSVKPIIMQEEQIPSLVVPSKKTKKDTQIDDGYKVEIDNSLNPQSNQKRQKDIKKARKRSQRLANKLETAMQIE